MKKIITLGALSLIALTSVSVAKETYGSQNLNLHIKHDKFTESSATETISYIKSVSVDRETGNKTIETNNAVVGYTVQHDGYGQINISVKSLQGFRDIEVPLQTIKEDETAVAEGETIKIQLPMSSSKELSFKLPEISEGVYKVSVKSVDRLKTAGKVRKGNFTEIVIKDQKGKKVYQNIV